jgi:hypothetical protein
MALFERSKKKMATEDYGDEGKTYVVVLNSNNKIGGTNNQASFNVDYSFLPKNYQYYKMNYSFQSAGGVYKDQIIEFGGSTSGNTLTISAIETISGVTQFCALNARLFSMMSNVAVPDNTYITAYGSSSVGALGTYTLSQMPLFDILSISATGTITSGSNVVTFAASRTGLLGMFITHTGGLTVGTRIIGGSGTTWYMNKVASSTNTAQTMVMYPAFQAKLNFSTANIHMDFGCKSYIYDNANNGPSQYVGVAQRYTQGTASNHFNLWHEQMPSQILNIHNSTGVITTTIYNGDDQASGGQQLMTDISLGGIPTLDFSPWIATISFTPILSSHIDTQSF